MTDLDIRYLNVTFTVESGEFVYVIQMSSLSSFILPDSCSVVNRSVIADLEQNTQYNAAVSLSTTYKLDTRTRFRTLSRLQMKPVQTFFQETKSGYEVSVMT